MFSPSSSPSVLASTSRHNIIQPLQQSQFHQQKSLRLFLGQQSDEEEVSDCDFGFYHASDDDSDSDESTLSLASASTSRQVLQPGRLPPSVLQSPTRRIVSNRLHDSNEGGIPGSTSPARRSVKRTRIGASPKKASTFAAPTAKQQTASSAAIPTTPTKRQKGFLVRGNVTPSRAFSIFKAAKQRSQQRQQHGLMTPPTSSPLRPIILDSLDSLDDEVDTSPSRIRARPISSIASPSSHLATDRPYTLTHDGQKLSAFSPKSPRYLSDAFKPSAFAGGANKHTNVSQALHRLRTRQTFHCSDGLFTAARFFSPTCGPTVDTTSFLETFVSPSSCVFQIPCSADEDILSHPICAAYSYSSRSVNPSSQWLAVGDDEGRITLLNTLPWQDVSAEQFTSNPQWQASSSSAIFEVVWRFDDRSILSGASDFSIRSWDTEYQKCTAEFEGHGGSPRTIVYDPTTNGDGGCGMVFASAGRDGTIRIWDARASSRGRDTDQDWVVVKPVLTIEAAHSTFVPAGVAVATKGRKQMRGGPAAGGRGRKRLQQQPLPAGITALSYLPDGQGHKLLSGGSANGIIKCWDLRHVRQSPSPVTQVDTQKVFDPPVSSDWETPDLSLLTPTSSAGLGSFKRAHGLSQIISSSTSLYASCTGGKIYSLPLSTFLDSHLTHSDVQTLYDPVQCQNTLFSRMALFNDRFLAVGCNTGNVALWDVTHPRSASRNKTMTLESESERDTEEEKRAAIEMEIGFAYRSQQEGMAVLTEGHAKNTEVNAVTWANGPNGPTLSSVGDDTIIRTWYADRQVRDSITRATHE